MRTTRQFLTVSAATMLVGVWACTQTPQRSQTANLKGPAPSAPVTNCSGTVTDAAGKPVAGATVEYWRYEASSKRQELKKLVTTGTNGAFEFQVSRASAYLLARKAGLAPGWRQLTQPFNSGQQTNQQLTLMPPAALAGVVMDESNKPVAKASVFVAVAARQDGTTRANYLSGELASNCFVAKTDAAGRFRIEHFPTNATAALAVQWPGKALRQSIANSQELNVLPWHAGQNDIKLVIEPTGIIEGKVVVEDNSKPLPVASLSLESEGRWFMGFGGAKSAKSGTNGAFRLSGVPAGSYQLRATFGTNEPPDWVAEAVPVSVGPGQTTRDLKVAATQGGLLEVTVVNKKDRSPIPKARVYAYENGFAVTGTSGSNGVALLRLPEGKHQVTADCGDMHSSRSQNEADVAAGQTNQIEIEMEGPQKIAGVVRGTNVQPAAGVSVRTIWGASEKATTKTDASGEFELKWNQVLYADSSSGDCLLVRDEEHNLAVAQDFDEDSGPLDLTLAPALTMVGRVECDGKPVTNASATLIFWTGNRGMHVPDLCRGTNIPGRFEIPALPAGRKYGIMVSAPGYGQKPIYNLEPSDAGRVELDPVEIMPANLKLGGQILDADEKPVPGCNVNLQGEGQPFASTRTDREGRFLFEHVCEGAAHVYANSSKLSGSISGEAGETNLVLHLGQQNARSVPASNSKPHKLKGVVTTPGGSPADGAQVAVFPRNDSSWVKTGSNGAYNLTWSLQPWQSQSGITLLVIRDLSRNLAATEELSEEITNLDAQLKPALSLAGCVKGPDGVPLVGSQVNVSIRAGPGYNHVNEQPALSDAQGRYEFKCLPADARYLVEASAKGHGQHQLYIPKTDPDTNRLELEPLVLKLADRVVAGQVLNDKDKPVSGVNLSLNGEDQPNDNTTTDNKGRFHFQVCEGRVQIFANYQGGFAQTRAEAGDTNIVITLNDQSGRMSQTPHRVPLKGRPLPDLTTVHLAAGAAPAGKRALLCLFDAGQRSSRHLLHALEERAPALLQQNLCVIGVQSPVTSDDVFNEWKTASPVSFPIGRATEITLGSRWALNAPESPWLVLTDASHQVIAEGFSLDELDAQLQKATK